MKEHRRHLRIHHRAYIKATFACGTIIEVHSRDISNSGLFLICDPPTPLKAGDRITIVSLEIADAVERHAKIIRIETDNGIGVEFID